MLGAKEVLVNSTDPQQHKDEHFRQHEGFSISLRDLDLIDIVQLECSRNEERCLEIISGHKVGYLYIEHHRIVHAEFDGLTGKEAALFILTWDQGEVREIEKELLKPSIDEPMQAIVLDAQLQKDEAQRNYMTGTVTQERSSQIRVKRPTTTARDSGIQYPSSKPSHPPPQPIARNSFLGQKVNNILELNIQGGPIHDMERFDEKTGFSLLVFNQLNSLASTLKCGNLQHCEIRYGEKSLRLQKGEHGYSISELG